MKALVRTILIILIFTTCDNFEFSPNQVLDGDSPHNLNARNIAKLKETIPDDTLTIAFVGDSQRFYDEVDDFVDKVNSIPSVDFVILDGDISDFGLLREFEWIDRSFSRLNVPYLGVIGNHDVIANGEKVFKNMFGPLNYSFVYDSIKFVMHNTNGREYIDDKIAVPDIGWLRSELQGEHNGDVKYFIAVSHVPPDGPDFRQDLIKPYTELFASTPGFLVSLHGHIHQHTDRYLFNDGVRYITSFVFSQREFVLLKIVDGQIIKLIIPY